jgi:hypothetical protein
MLPKHNKIQPNLVKFLLWAIANVATLENWMVGGGGGGGGGGYACLEYMQKAMTFNSSIKLLEVQKRGL